ncbi:MAG: flagellar motor switch protein FliN [Deltaproteobacteria bacterium]|nr:flagellar motor switch protein FliN [Deltaproteobacteria bacterium]
MEEETMEAVMAAEAAAALSAEEAAQMAAFAEVLDEQKPVQGVGQGQGQEPAPREIDFLLDIPLVVSVEIGRTRMLIKDLLQLGQGSVIEFDKLVGEPMEVLVNEKLVARGEVVVVNEKFGVRLTDISSPAERLKHLK